VRTVVPGINHPARQGMDRVRVPWALLSRGPALSRRPLDLATTAAFVLGGALLVWSAAIHYHLWSEPDGYRSIATIGPLFLLQSIAGLVIGVGLVVVRRLWMALLGIGFAAATVAGFLVSVTHGLFGFQESWLAPFAAQAFAIELVAAGLLVVAGALCLAAPSHQLSRRTAPGPEA
jgi:hypothetical protein